MNSYALFDERVGNSFVGWYWKSSIFFKNFLKTIFLVTDSLLKEKKQASTRGPNNNLLYIWIIIEMIQMISLTLSERFLYWDDIGLSKDLYSFFSVFLLQFSWGVILLRIIYSYIFIVFLCGIYIGYCVTKNQVYTQFPMSLLLFSIRSMQSYLFLPIVTNLSFCYNSSVETLVVDLVFGSLALFLVLFFIGISRLIFLETQFFSKSKYFDHSASSHKRIDFLYFIIKALLPFFFDHIPFKFTAYVSIIFMLLMFAILFMRIFWLPYYLKAVNQFSVSAQSTVFLASLMLIISQNSTLEINTLGIAFLSIFVPFAYFAWYITGWVAGFYYAKPTARSHDARQYFLRWLPKSIRGSSSRQKSKKNKDIDSDDEDSDGENELIQSKPLLESKISFNNDSLSYNHEIYTSEWFGSLYVPTDAHFELHTRFLLEHKDKESLAIAKKIFLSGLEEFSDSSIIVLAYARYLTSLEDYSHAIDMLKRIELSHPTIDTSFFVLNLLRIIQDSERGGFRLDQRQSDEEEITRELKLANKEHFSCIQLLSSFWKSLLDDEVELNVLDERVSKLVNTIQNASMFYTNLINRWPKSPRILRAYSHFIDQVRNDPWEAQNCLLRADTIEDEISKSRSVKIDQKIEADKDRKVRFNEKAENSKTYEKYDSVNVIVKSEPVLNIYLHDENDEIKEERNEDEKSDDEYKKISETPIEEYHQQPPDTLSEGSSTTHSSHSEVSKHSLLSSQSSASSKGSSRIRSKWRNLTQRIIIGDSSLATTSGVLLLKSVIYLFVIISIALVIVSTLVTLSMLNDMDNSAESLDSAGFLPSVVYECIWSTVLIDLHFRDANKHLLPNLEDIQHGLNSIVDQEHNLEFLHSIDDVFFERQNEIFRQMAQDTPDFLDSILSRTVTIDFLSSPYSHGKSAHIQNSYNPQEAGLIFYSAVSTITNGITNEYIINSNYTSLQETGYFQEYNIIILNAGKVAESFDYIRERAYKYLYEQVEDLEFVSYTVFVCTMVIFIVLAWFTFRGAVNYAEVQKEGTIAMVGSIPRNIIVNLSMQYSGYMEETSSQHRILADDDGEVDYFFHQSEEKERKKDTNKEKKTLKSKKYKNAKTRSLLKKKVEEILAEVEEAEDTSNYESAEDDGSQSDDKTMDIVEMMENKLFSNDESSDLENKEEIETKLDDEEENEKQDITDNNSISDDENENIEDSQSKRFAPLTIKTLPTTKDVREPVHTIDLQMNWLTKVEKYHQKKHKPIKILKKESSFGYIHLRYVIAFLAVIAISIIILERSITSSHNILDSNSNIAFSHLRGNYGMRINHFSTMLAKFIVADPQKHLGNETVNEDCIMQELDCKTLDQYYKDLDVQANLLSESIDNFKSIHNALLWGSSYYETKGYQSGTKFDELHQIYFDNMCSSGYIDCTGWNQSVLEIAKVGFHTNVLNFILAAQSFVIDHEEGFHSNSRMKILRIEEDILHVASAAIHNIMSDELHEIQNTNESVQLILLGISIATIICSYIVIFIPMSSVLLSQARVSRMIFLIIPPKLLRHIPKLLDMLEVGNADIDEFEMDVAQPKRNEGNNERENENEKIEKKKNPNNVITEEVQEIESKSEITHYSPLGVQKWFLLQGKYADRPYVATAISFGFLILTFILSLFAIVGGDLNEAAEKQNFSLLATIPCGILNGINPVPGDILYSIWHGEKNQESEDFLRILYQINSLGTISVFIILLGIPIDKVVVIWGSLGGIIGTIIGKTSIENDVYSHFDTIVMLSIGVGSVVGLILIKILSQKSFKITKIENSVFANTEMILFGIIGGILSSATGTGVSLMLFTFIVAYYQLDFTVALPSVTIPGFLTSFIVLIFTLLFEYEDLAEEAIVSEFLISGFLLSIFSLASAYYYYIFDTTKLIFAFVFAMFVPAGIFFSTGLIKLSQLFVALISFFASVTIIYTLYVGSAIRTKINTLTQINDDSSIS